MGQAPTATGERPRTGRPSDASRAASLDVLTALLIAAAGPTLRVAVVYPAATAALFALAMGVEAWLIALRSRVDPRSRRSLDAALVGTVLLASAVTLPVPPSMADPDVLLRAVLPCWVAACALLATWVVGDLRLPLLGRFDRRLASPVVAASLLAAQLARSPDRLTWTLAAVVLAAAVALAVNAARGPTERALERIDMARDSVLADAPRALVVAVGGAWCWLVLNTGLWTIGLMRGTGITYGAWSAGVSTQRPWVHDVLALSGVVVIPVAVLALGALLALGCRRELGRVVRWTVAAILLGIASGFVWYWVAL